jgi:major intracellular serine protease
MSKRKATDGKVQSKHVKASDEEFEPLADATASVRQFTTRAAAAIPPVPSGVWVIGAPLLWREGIEGKSLVVGVLDTGIDDTHPDLKGKVLGRRDYVNDGLPTTRFNLHGTHVAGTIAADGKIKGVAPKAMLRDYRVLNARGSGSFSSITKAVDDAVRDGCHVLNMSLGGTTDYRPLHEAIQRAAAKGVLVVAAAGNEGDGAPNTIEISYPGYYSEVLGVAAVEFGEADGKVVTANFSNSNREVDVCADGIKVLSCKPGGGYVVLQGTSMASPHVAGFVCLLIERLRKRNGFAVGLDTRTLITVLKSYTVDVDEVGIDASTGAGMVSFYPQLPSRAESGDWQLDGVTYDAP